MQYNFTKIFLHIDSNKKSLDPALYSSFGISFDRFTKTNGSLPFLYKHIKRGPGTLQTLG